MHLRRNFLATAAVASLAISGFAVAVPAAHAAPDGTGLVISEVYGGGGNSGATYNQDFVEIYNPTDAAIDVSQMSVQYRSAGGSADPSGVAPLTGEVAPGEYYVVALATGATGAALPVTPDVTNTGVNLSGSNGTVFLANQTGALTAPPTGSITGDPAIADLVGFGSSNTFETAAAPAASTTTTQARDADGTDTDDNSADLAVGAITPGAAPEEPEEPTDPTELTIAEIQGDAATTPVAGDAVTTTGVVTAAYPAGGFYGFYLQTEGTGGATDLAARTASDGIFVYQTQGAGAVTVEPGDHVEVTGTAGEHAGATQISVAAAADIVTLPEAADPIEPVTSAWPGTDTQRESLEGMLFSADGDFTVTNTYSTNQYGEVGLAQGATPLIQPTEVARPGTDEADAIAQDNAARGIVLDDGSSTNYFSRQDATPPYVSNENPVVVGAGTTFDEPVILTQGGSPSSPTYRFQPTSPATDDVATWPATFEDVRAEAPDEALVAADGTPDFTVASFNVLNYFTTLGDADDDNVGDGGCEAYADRDGDGNNVRGGCDQRGAWDPEDLERQQEKIVAAINGLDADVVGLMEIENSAALGEETDEATQSLVDALNAAAGDDVWAANPSSADLPPAAELDVITNAIIYKTDAVERVGDALALGDQSGDDQAFGNAREPIGQVFAPVDGGEEFLFVVNHFKSKGSAGPWPGDEDAGDGQGASNESRVRQATALRDWVSGVESDTGVDDVFLAGDFNAYTAEDPLQVLYDAGYADTEAHFGNDEYSYSYQGLSGSLDHVLVNDGALARLTGTDIWNINSGESVAMEYSRYNYHGTDFHTSDVYRSSDHDPVVVGVLDTAPESGVASSTTRAKATPAKAQRGTTRVKLRVRVRTEGGPATGRVQIRAGGLIYRVRLENGAATVRLKPYYSLGVKKVRVRYLGNATTEPSRDVVTIKVVKRTRR